MTTWADIKKGDAVTINGRTYTVAKHKPKGKKAAVILVGAGGRFENIVKLKDTVARAAPKAPKRSRKSEPEPDWYKPSKAERKAAKHELRDALPEGDRHVTEPPAPAKGGAWDEPKSKAERALESLLEARLVAESPDEAVGYYVPPIDAETVAAHWMLMHEGDDWVEVGESELLEHHKRQHEAALAGFPLKVNHWHTAQRPTIKEPVL